MSLIDKARKRTTTSRAKKKGTGKRGRKPTKYLEWHEVKAIIQLVYETRINAVVDIKPPFEIEGDMPRKQFIQDFTRRLFQALKRRGQKVIAATIYEKGGPNDAPLHAHVLIRIEPKNRDVLERFADLPVIRCEWLDTVADARAKAKYRTKQRRPLSPEFEAVNGHTYQKDVKPVPGVKLSLTRAAKALMADLEQRKMAA
jgi:hypothetical protein